MPGVAKQINGIFVWKVTKDSKDAGKMIRCCCRNNHEFNRSWHQNFLLITFVDWVANFVYHLSWPCLMNQQEDVQNLYSYLGTWKMGKFCFEVTLCYTKCFC